MALLLILIQRPRLLQSCGRINFSKDFQGFCGWVKLVEGKRRENIKHCQVLWVQAGNKHVTCFLLARTQLHHNGEQWRMWTNGVSSRRGIGLGDQLCGVFHFPSMPMTQEAHCNYPRKTLPLFPVVRKLKLEF